MFDLNGDGDVDAEEFEKVQVNISCYNFLSYYNQIIIKYNIINKL